MHGSGCKYKDEHSQIVLGQWRNLQSVARRSLLSKRQNIAQYEGKCMFIDAQHNSTVFLVYSLTELKGTQQNFMQIWALVLTQLEQ